MPSLSSLQMSVVLLSWPLNNVGFFHLCSLQKAHLSQHCDNCCQVFPLIMGLQTALVGWRGGTPNMPIMGLMSCYIGDLFHLFSPFSLSVWIVSCMTPGLQLYISYLVGPFDSVSNICLTSSWPTAFLIWLCRCCYIDISVLYVCFVFHVMSLPIFVTFIAYKCPLWSPSLGCTMTPCIHDPPSCHRTATLDLQKRQKFFLEYHCSYIYSMGLQNLVLCIIIIYIYGFSTDLKQEVPYGSVEQHCSWAQKPCLLLV